MPLPDIDSTEVNFNISLPSDEYMLLLLNTHKLPNTTLYFLKKELIEGKNCKIQDILNFIVKKLRIYTLKIKSEKSLNCSDFIDLTNSYMIFSAYKHNSVFSIRNPFNVNWIQVLVGRYYSDEIMSKKFEEELINYYKTAILTENPFIEFISFYHIIEYFFEQVKNEFKKEIKLSDIKGFEASEKDLKKILIENKFHDNKMLTLVLIKYINKAELEEEILSYGTNFDYYFNSPVLFADAKPIKNDLFHTTLSERIRLIRNSLVHRKEGKKRKYLPFEKDHKNELEKEIILMRAIATQIMIKSSDN